MTGFNFASLNGFDWLLLALTCLSTAAAFARGIIRVLFSIAGLIAGLLLASWNYLALANTLRPYFTSSQADEILSFVLILAAVSVVFLLAGILVRRTVAAVGLGLVDRLLGAVFGLLRGVLLGAIILASLAVFAPGSPWIRNSQLAPYLLDGTRALASAAPRTLRQQITSGSVRLLEQPAWEHSNR